MTVVMVYAVLWLLRNSLLGLVLLPVLKVRGLPSKVTRVNLTPSRHHEVDPCQSQFRSRSGAAKPHPRNICKPHVERQRPAFTMVDRTSYGMVGSPLKMRAKYILVQQKFWQRGRHHVLS